MISINDNRHLPPRPLPMTVSQLMYRSLSTRWRPESDLTEIFRASRDHNALNGITGLLWSDGTYFVQLIEGPSASVEETLGRIRRDIRHHNIVILLDGSAEHRAFSSWSMLYKRAFETNAEYDQRRVQVMSKVDGLIHDTFDRLISGRETRTPID